MFKLPKKPLNVFQILKAGLSFWQQNLMALCGLTLTAMILSAIPAFLFPPLNSFNPDVLTKFVDERIELVLLFSVIMFLVFAFIIHRVHAMMFQLKTTWVNSVKVAVFKLPALIVALVIFYVLVMIGFMLFIIPGIGLSILLSLYFLLIVVENLGPIQAFKKSWALVSDHWFHTFFVIVIMSTVIATLSFLIKTGSQDLWVIAHPFGEGVFHLGNRIIRIVSGTLFYGVFCSILLMLYHDLTLRFVLKQKSDESDA